MSNPLTPHLPNPLELPLPWVVAEAGQTMCGDLDVAVIMVKQMALAGAWGFKTQLLRPETIATADAEPYWLTTRHATTQRGAFSKAGLVPYDGWGPVVEACERYGLTWFASPFDVEAVEVAEKHYAPACWKIASGDITNVPLLRAVNGTGKPVFLSTGGSTHAEIERALVELGRCKVIPLACTLTYPAMANQAELGRIHLLGRRLDYRRNVLGIGYSDHTLGAWCGPAATFAGALVLEKHVRPDEAAGDVADNDMALTARDLQSYTREAQLARWPTVAELGMAPHEAMAVRGARRSLYLARDVAEGADIFADDLAVLRPCLGGEVLGPEAWDTAVSCIATHDLTAGEPLRYPDLHQPGKLFP